MLRVAFCICSLSFGRLGAVLFVFAFSGMALNGVGGVSIGRYLPSLRLAQHSPTLRESLM